MLQVEDIHFNYGKNQILKNISFDVEEGLLCGLFGPNGCGKTTLFKCCMKFLKFHKGSVVMDGIDIKKHRIEDMAKVVAYVPQEHKPPFPYLVKEVVLMGRTPHLGGFFGVKRADKKKALDALELLDISHLGEQPYNQLSGGQRQMVLIARAIAQETKLIFLDEPTSALDFSNQMRIWTLLRKVAEQGITILACSHDPNHVTWFCDKVVVMNNNGIIGQGAPNHVITETILDEIYQNMCTVRSLGKVKMILPRDVAVKKRLETKTDARAPNECIMTGE
ncbi:MAG: ABC transporter ATP-binding protein [Methanosarcinales archaeon]|nr:ABC transporter ATP-binding protein [Methanosarcinales archaeon]